MTATRHGHHISGTTLNEEEKLLSKARCGGPSICRECYKDVAKEAQTNPEVEW